MPALVRIAIVGGLAALLFGCGGGALATYRDLPTDCSEIAIEMDDRAARIDRVLAAGQARDVAAGVATLAVVLGAVVPGYAAAIPILNGVEVSTAGDRRRLDALFHARLTAGCEG